MLLEYTNKSTYLSAFLFSFSKQLLISKLLSKKRPIPVSKLIIELTLPLSRTISTTGNISFFHQGPKYR